MVVSPSMLRRIFKFILKTLAALLGLILLYVLTAFSLQAVSVNADFRESETDFIEIYILSNGVHTDIVVPLKTAYKDWTTFVNPRDTRSGSLMANYVAFGWGDKAFYLETPEWADLKFKTAFNALFYLGSSAMHVTFYGRMKADESCKRIRIDRQRYEELTRFIESTFVLKEGKPALIENAFYWNNDVFYEAEGRYSLFYTCNTWANSGLKAAGLKACLWTPFDKGIFSKYE